MNRGDDRDPRAGPSAARGSAVSLRVAPVERTAPTLVTIGEGVLEDVEAVAASSAPGARRLFVVDAGVADEAVQRRWGASRLPRTDALVVPAGERAKTREEHARIEDAVLDRGLTRDDVIVAVGGGAVLDVAGYAASTVRRGLAWIAVPTSLVAMADASIGGKTGIDHAMGKNLLGTFHPPVRVLADIRTLSTLPARDFTAGLAELYKAGVVGDASILATLRAGVPRADAPLVGLIARALAVKAALVERDLRDGGPRRALNYGHTAGHALETLFGPDAMRHGEAVAIGMGVAAEIARARGGIDAAWVARQDGDLRALGLPTAVPRGADATRLRELMRVDKKRRSGLLHTLVLPRAASGVDVVEDATTGELDAALDARRSPR